MKKLVLQSLIIALIVFFWQFISNAGANFHKASMQYTDKQDTVLAFMQSVGLKQGEYLIPQVDPSKPNTSMKDWEQYFGKPWMFVRYYENRSNGMAMSMVRGFITDWIFGLILLMFLGVIGPVTLKKSLAIHFGLALMMFIMVPYTNHIWYPKADIFASLLDCVVPMLIIALLNAKYWHPISASNEQSL